MIFFVHFFYLLHFDPGFSDFGIFQIAIGRYTWVEATTHKPYQGQNHNRPQDSLASGLLIFGCGICVGIHRIRHVVYKLSNGDSYDLVEGKFIISTVVQLGSSRAFVVGELLVFFQRSAIREIVCYAGGTKGMTTDGGFDAGIHRSSANHLVNKPSCHPFRGELLRLSLGRAE